MGAVCVLVISVKTTHHQNKNPQIFEIQELPELKLLILLQSLRFQYFANGARIIKLRYL